MSLLENLCADENVEHHGDEDDEPREGKCGVRVTGEKC